MSAGSINRLRVAACQLNTVVGDLEGNVAMALAALKEAEAAGADVAVFPELAITGYPPEDLLLKRGFVEANLDALHHLAAATGRCAAVVGFVDVGGDPGGSGVLRNAAAVCAHGAVRGRYHKRRLPNYAVFDEQRYFTAGADPIGLFVIGGVVCGVSICEDAWVPGGPVAAQAAGGAQVVLNLNASPYHAGRVAQREAMLAARAAEGGCALVYVNQVGGQDELVFDGGSMVLDRTGRILASAPQFGSGVFVTDLDLGSDPAAPAPTMTVTTVTERPAESPGAHPPTRAEPLAPLDEVYAALVLGTADYVAKNGFTDVVIGLSGGIDSSLVAAVAASALGPDHVHGVSMPSRYSSEGSRSDAAALAVALGIEMLTVPIEAAHGALLEMCQPHFGGREPDLAEENLQSRIRGVVLMALSNKLGWMVLTTGNKSEMAVGYSTLYGDTAGGFAVLKDVPKTMVFRLSRRVNEVAGRAVIPEAVLDKPPSAELRPDQRDDQSLPPYEVLDPILAAYVEGDGTVAQLVAAGFDADVVRRVVGLVDRSEYKRRQTPPGVRVTSKAFGKDRRLPITNRFSG